MPICISWRHIGGISAGGYAVYCNKTVSVITYINEKKIISQERNNYFVATYYYFVYTSSIVYTKINSYEVAKRTRSNY